MEQALAARGKRRRVKGESFIFDAERARGLVGCSGGWRERQVVLCAVHTM